MTQSTDKREQTLIEKYGSKEALAQKRKEWQTKSRLNPNTKKGGFAYLKEHDPEKLSEVQRANANRRWDNEKAQNS